MANQTWTQQLDRLFQFALVAYDGEPTFDQIKRDARFKLLADYPLFDQSFFELHVQRDRLKKATTKAAQSLSSDASALKAKKKVLRSSKSGFDGSKESTWLYLLKRLFGKGGASTKVQTVGETIEIENQMLLRQILGEFERMNQLLVQNSARRHRHH